MKIQKPRVKYGTAFLTALVAVFALVFCPCGVAEAAVTHDLQTASAVQDHDCCNKKKAPCETDTCQFTSLETPDYAKQEIKMPDLSGRLLFVRHIAEVERILENTFAGRSFRHTVFDLLHPAGPPIHIRHSLLLI